jgi:hypothetical protein
MRPLNKFDIIRLWYEILLIISLSSIVQRIGCNNNKHDKLMDMQVVCYWYTYLLLQFTLPATGYEQIGWGSLEIRFYSWQHQLDFICRLYIFSYIYKLWFSIITNGL